MSKKFTAVAIFALLTAAHAQAIPVLNFQGVANLANVADFYNGGTDSIGNTLGYNYGIHFNAYVALNEAGAYVKGASTMTVAANLFGENVPYLIKFNAAVNRSLDGELSFISGPHYSDSAYIGSTRNPYCSTEAICLATGYRYIHPSQMDGYVFYSEGGPTTVSFHTDRLDNIEFVRAPGNGFNMNRPLSLPGAGNLDRDIPEPASIALLALGAAGMVALRRRGAKTAA